MRPFEATLIARRIFRNFCTLISSNGALDICIDASLGGYKNVNNASFHYLIPSDLVGSKYNGRISREYNENPRQDNIFLNYLAACNLCADARK